jgi:histidinol dehydrogenase
MDKLTPVRLSQLSPEARRALVDRSKADIADIYAKMRNIVADVAKRGDAVICEHYRKLRDPNRPEDFIVSEEETEAAFKALDPKVLQALKKAAANIEKFHRAQLEREMWQMEIAPGVIAGRINRPLDSAGCYVPGGKAAYPSSVLMTVIPARVAGVKKVIACTPPGPGISAHPATIAAAKIAGADLLLKVGGPWAVAAMAYGTGICPKVDKIVGPGNKYVTAAKMIVYGEVDIDSPAGPSEALILADDTAKAELVALDLLSQVEHDEDAAAVLVTTSAKLAEDVAGIIAERLPKLPRREIMEAALAKHSALVVADSMDEAIDFTNEYAAEHLEIVTADVFATLARIRHAGSIFMGPWAPVPVGDYASGTNHVLPTGGCARMFSGLSVDDFIKKPTYQYLTRDGLKGLKDTVITLAEAEGLYVHAEAVRARFKV